MRDWLTENEVALPPMATEAAGEREPLKPNANPDGSDIPEGRAFNRRVEIVLEPCKVAAHRVSGAADGGVTHGDGSPR